jgi:hypothetical protein
MGRSGCLNCGTSRPSSNPERLKLLESTIYNEGNGVVQNNSLAVHGDFYFSKVDEMHVAPSGRGFWHGFGGGIIPGFVITAVLLIVFVAFVAIK